MTLGRCCDMHNIGRRHSEHLADIRKTSGNAKPLTKLLGHQCFLVANRNDSTIGDPLNCQEMLIGDLAATDYGHTKHSSNSLFELAEKRSHCLLHGHSRFPLQTILKLTIGVGISLPLRGAATPVENRRYLAHGPLGVFLPEPTHDGC